MDFSWSFLFGHETIAAMASGLRLTLLLTVCSGVGALAIGAAIAATQAAGVRVLALAGRGYIDFVRNVPLLIQLFFVYFGITIVFPPNLYPLMRSPHLNSVVTVGTISVVMGGFVAEVIRAGVEAVAVGQTEAGLASGLRMGSVWRHIILPQLAPIVLPGLSNEMINTLKATTFAMTIGVAELMWQAQKVEAESFRGVETMTAVTLVYLLLSAGIIGLFRVLERWFRIVPLSPAV